jgi:hypothetical protein
MTSVERRPGSLSGLTDDQLGTIAVSLVISELRWSPDVAPAVMDRISRDAVAYPEHFDRRPTAGAPLRLPARPGEPSLTRTLGRFAVLAIIVMLVAALVLVAATANAAPVFHGDIAVPLLAPVSATETS